MEYLLHINSFYIPGFFLEPSPGCILFCLGCAEGFEVAKLPPYMYEIIRIPRVILILDTEHTP